MAYQYLKEACKKDGEGQFIREHTDRTKGNMFKMKMAGFISDILKKFFPQKAVRHWNSCPEKQWIPHPWKCSRPDGIGLKAIWSSSKYPCPCQGA